jgi:tetratricopeptide (TPR) repeat protein/tRNA A-37 threonylcarbamoyl transferase component Bud32
MGRFTVVRAIAAGGMGAVFEATDGVLRTSVAIKVIRSDVASDATSKERFRREVLLARRVGHPNVCRVYELYEAMVDGAPLHFLTMELLKGETVARRLQTKGRFTTGEAAPLVKQMCEGLAAAHAEGVIHRDFKSSNVMLVPREAGGGERVVITDFGVAHAVGAAVGETSGEPLTGGEGMLGTPAYMAPEQVTGGEVTAATDIYALGVVVYEMVTGKLPFAGDTPLIAAAKRLNEAPPRPDEAVPGLDAPWALVIRRCMAREPGRRFRNSLEVAEALDSAPSLWPRRATVAVVLFALAVGILTLGRFGPELKRGRPNLASVVKPRPVIAILGIRDEVASAELGWLPTAVSELLTHEVAAAETSLRLIPTDRVAEVRRSLGVAEDDVVDGQAQRRMEALLGANVLVSGRLAKRKDAGGIRLHIRALDAQTGQELGRFDEDLGANGAQLTSQVPVLAGRVLEAMGVGMSSQERVALEASRANSGEAAQLYADGVRSLRRFDYDDARSRFQAALAADARFLDAQRRIVQTWQAQENKKRAQEAAKRVRARTDALTPQQAAEVDARILSLGPDERKALDALLGLLEATPDDVELGVALASPVGSPLHPALEETMPPRAKLALVGRLRRLPAPASVDLRLDLSEAGALGGLGDTKRAHEVLARAETRAKELGAKAELASLVREEGELIWTKEGHGVEALARFEEAARTFAELGDLEGLVWTKDRIVALLTNLGPPQRVLAAASEMAGFCRRLGNHVAIHALLTVSAEQLLFLGELKAGQRALEQARLEAAAADEPPGLDWQFIRADLALAEADLDEARRAANDLKTFRGVGEGEAESDGLVQEAAILREEDHLDEARESLLRAAKLEEQRGSPLGSKNLARRACELDCDKGRGVEGVACLAEHSLAGMSRDHTAAGSLIEAKCRYKLGDLAAAERAGQEALSKTDRFARRVDGTALLMRIRAARGETAKALSGLRALVTDVDAKPGNRRLGFEVALALGEVELKAGRPEGRTRLLQLEREAKSREFFRIVRLAREALNRGHVKPQAAAR